MISGSMKISDDENENNDAGNYRININKTRTSKSFEYKTKVIRNTPVDNNTLDTEVVVPLKYLSNFWTLLNVTLINCELELDLSRSKNCIISELLRTTAVADNPDANPPVLEVAATQTTGTIFQINIFMLQLLLCLWNLAQNF